MSAFLISSETLDVLVRAAITYPRHGSTFSWVARSLESTHYADVRLGFRRVYQLDNDLEQPDAPYAERSTWTPQDIGQCLWDWNARSLLERYPETPIEEWNGGPLEYEAPIPSGPLSLARNFQPTHETPAPLTVLAQAACLRYQACEHSTWDLEPAYALLEAIREAAIERFPGYRDQPWGVEPQPEAVTS